MGIQMFLLHLLQKHCKTDAQTTNLQLPFLQILSHFLVQLPIIFNMSTVLTLLVLTFTQNLTVFTVLEQLHLSNTLKFSVVKAMLTCTFKNY